MDKAEIMVPLVEVERIVQHHVETAKTGILEDLRLVGGGHLKGALPLATVALSRASTLLAARCPDAQPFKVKTWERGGQDDGKGRYSFEVRSDLPGCWFVNPWDPKYGEKGVGRTGELNCCPDNLRRRLRRRDRFELQGLLSRVNGEKITEGIRRVFAEVLDIPPYRIQLSAVADLVDSPPRPDDLAWRVRWAAADDHGWPSDFGYVAHDGHLATFEPEIIDQFKPRHLGELKGVTVGSLWRNV